MQMSLLPPTEIRHNALVNDIKNVNWTSVLHNAKPNRAVNANVCKCMQIYANSCKLAYMETTSKPASWMLQRHW